MDSPHPPLLRSASLLSRSALGTALFDYDSEIQSVIDNHKAAVAQSRETAAARALPSCELDGCVFVGKWHFMCTVAGYRAAVPHRTRAVATVQGTLRLTWIQ
jgi:hypothetical protein